MQPNINTVSGPWSESESLYLIEHYPNEGAKAVAAALSRTVSSVNNRVRLLGLKANKPPRWAGKLIEGLVEAEVAELVRRWQEDGYSLLQISAAWEVSRFELWQICKREGVVLRTPSEDMKRRWATATPEQRETMLQSAHARTRELWQNGEHHAHYASLAEARRTPEVIAARKERARHVGAIWRDNNREHVRELKRAYRRNFPHKCKVWDERKRQKRNAAPGTFKEHDVRLKYEQQDGKCYWCQRPLEGVYHVDHVIALARGGTNWPSNICCACPSCNQHKSTKMPWDFAGRLL